MSEFEPYITHDRSGPVYINFSHEPVAETVEVKHTNVLIDYDADGKLVGIEVLR